MTTTKTPAAVISMPATPPADRTRELCAALHELNDATQAVMRTLDILLGARRPQRARNLAVVPKRRK